MTISKRLPKKKTAPINYVSARVPAELRKQVSVILAQKEISWQAFLVACLEQFINENKRGEK